MDQKAQEKKAQPARAYLRQLDDWQRIAQVVEDFLAGQVPEKRDTNREEPPDEEVRRLHFKQDLLRWALDTKTEAAMQWEVVEKTQSRADRDALVLKLWTTLKGDGPNADLRQTLIEGRWRSWTFYERYFFGWFLDRFHISAALRVYAKAWQVRAFWACALGVVLAMAATFFLPFKAPFYPVPLTVGVVGALLLKLTVYQVPWQAFLNAAIPRLGATVGIGYLFLLAAPHVVRLVYESDMFFAHFLLLYLVVAVSLVAFVVLQIRRRVAPLPRLATSVRRAVGVVLFAFGYALAGSALLTPVLFAPSILDGPQTPALPQGAPSPYHLLLVAAVALVVGVVLQLVWEEKPLTQPL